MRNAGLDEAQARIKIALRNINNLIYTDDTTLVAESEELKSLLMKVKEPVPLLHGKQMGKQWQTLFLWAPKLLQMVTAAMKLKEAYSLEGKL